MSAEQDITRQINLMHPPGNVFPIFAKNGKFSNGGYFNDAAKAQAAIIQLAKTASGIYIGLNPCKPELLSRANNTVKPGEGKPTDADIIEYRHIYIDVDPNRKGGTAATDAQHKAALQTAQKIKDILQAVGWGLPLLFNDSGNGACLIYRIVTLPATDESTKLIKDCLSAIDKRFSNDQIKIDTVVCDPSRIVRLAGTMNKKGDEVPELEIMHRRARIIESNEQAQRVTIEQLQALAAESKQTAAETPGNMLDVKKYCSEHGIEVIKKKRQGDSTLYCLRHCIFDPTHGPNEAAIVQADSGKLTYQCFHDSCTGKTWADVRALITGTASLKQYMPPEEWPQPISFDDFSLLPDFPAETLPKVGAEMVKAISESNQVDAALPGLLYLSVLATSAAKKAEVDLQTHKEPVNLFTVSFADSGNRKTSTLDLISKPLYEQQAEDQRRLKHLVRDAINAHKIREARLFKFQKKAANSDDRGIRVELQETARTIAAEIEANPVPAFPQYMTDDVTPEKLALSMFEQGERMAILSAEAGLFDIMAGRYDKSPNLDIYLKGHAGDPFSAQRIGRAPITMQAPALTIGLSVQTDLLNDLSRESRFRGRGLTARFLFALCKSQIGNRQRKNKPVSDSLKAVYSQHVRDIMRLPIPEVPAALQLTPEGMRIWEEFYNDIEAEMRPGGSLEHLTDWGSKLPGAVARIAGLFHIAQSPANLNHSIAAETVINACILGAYLKEHALAVFGMMNEDPRIKSAKIILKYITEHPDRTFKGRVMLEKKRIFKTLDDVTPGLKVLIDRGYIKEEVRNYTGTGRPEAVSYSVNPKIKTLNKPSAERSESQTEKTSAVFC